MKNPVKNFLTYLILAVFVISFLFFGHRICKNTKIEVGNETYATAKVTEIISVEEVDSAISGESEKGTRVVFNATITSGDYKGKSVEVTQYSDAVFTYREKQVEKGDKIVLVCYENGTDADFWQFAEYNRMPWLLALVGIFFVLILVIGRIKGVGTILSLVITALSVLLVYLPGILRGYNVYILTVVVATFVIISSLVMLNGVSKKTFAAITGNVAGVFIASLLALLLGKVMYITGIVDENFIYLTNLETPINLSAVVWGGTVIGAVGAVMDVSIEIASSINELALNMSEKTVGKLFRSGMNIGRDAIGTMSNTLILAYVGCSLSTMLLLSTYSNSLLYILNTEMVVVELIQAVIGSIGILLAVPLTAFVGAVLFGNEKNGKTKKRKKEEDEKPLTDEEFWGERF